MKIKSVIIAVLAFVVTSAYTPATEHNLMPKGKAGSFGIIKGHLIDKGNDGVWDVLSFGLKSGISNGYRVTKVEVFQNENEIATFSDFGDFKDNGTSFYFLDISDLGIVGDFYTRIFIKDKFGGLITLAAAAVSDGTTPEDPDETVIVVRWP